MSTIPAGRRHVQRHQEREPRRGLATTAPSTPQLADDTVVAGGRTPLDDVELAHRYDFWVVHAHRQTPSPEFLVDFTLEVSPKVRVSQTDQSGRASSACAGCGPRLPPATQVLRLKVPRSCLRTTASRSRRGCGSAPMPRWRPRAPTGHPVSGRSDLGQERLTVARAQRGIEVESAVRAVRSKGDVEDAGNEPQKAQPDRGGFRGSQRSHLTQASLCGGSVAVPVAVTGIRVDTLLVLGLVDDQRLGRQQHRRDRCRVEQRRTRHLDRVEDALRDQVAVLPGGRVVARPPSRTLLTTT